MICFNNCLTKLDHIYTCIGCKFRHIKDGIWTTFLYLCTNYVYMKQLSVLVPECHTNLSSIVLTYEILLAANEYYARLGKKPVFNIQLVSNVKTAVSHNGLFAVHPSRSIKDKYAADLVIIPSVDEHFD